ncbi:chromosome segregation protein SMC [Frankia sp. CiP3]|uniref:chromosome segregation protein SMC n=1 Tax=Frankia sp. CiP3 TaxID=2880971 RepID=UPI001EF54395|nr:chromosome segregation protein SMC [Frankia sp. CiP3]
MHLKSLTLRGFKSFASSTTLHLEPGITCVVGPNGSGKSNVVDAMAWVLGEQGAKALRGGTMSDVIFAGTPSRPPLGRAEVLLTIDNTDGALPIEYSEVTVGRLMFRSGESEYTINGSSCRLLDIQELMSDSGIGRELHVIVGQGQLDAVLHARPEDRRAFIEEAAGVLKHRKRKEKALRKLEAMAANLTRLTDLSAELRRQLGPLGRQAEIARKAGVIQAAVRDSRLRLLADDIVTARGDIAADNRDEEALRVRLAAAGQAYTDGQRREQILAAELAAVTPQAAAAGEVWHALASLRERVRGTRSLAAERVRLLRSGAEEQRGGRDPEQLEQEAAAVREQENALGVRLDADRDNLAEVVARRAGLETALAGEEKALVAAAREASSRRENLARLAGRVEAARSRAASAETEIVRISEAVDAARQRGGETSDQRVALESELARMRTTRSELTARHAEAMAVHADATARLENLRAQERSAERDRASWQARGEALILSLTPKDGAAALLDAAGSGRDNGAARSDGAPARPTGVLGRLAALLAVEPGAEAAMAAVLGPAADAVAVGAVEDVAAVFEWLRAVDAGRASLLVAGRPSGDGPVADGCGTDPVMALSADARRGGVPAVDLVRVSDPRYAVGVARLLAATIVVADLTTAVELVREHPGIRAVTRAGDVIGPELATGGSARAPSLLELRAAADEAESRMLAAASSGERARGAVAAAAEEVKRARSGIDDASAALHGADARHRALSEQLSQLERANRSGAAEIERLERVRMQAETARDQAYGALAELEAMLAATSSEPDVGDRSPAERDRLAAATSAVRGEEVEARLAVRTSEERARALAGRADALVRSAANERAARLAAARRREVRERQATVAAAVADAAGHVLAALENSLVAADTERGQAEARRLRTETDLTAVREQVRTRAGELAALRDDVHRDELARAEKRLRVETLEAKAFDEHGIAVDDLVSEYGPHVPVPPDTPDGEAVAFDRADQAARAAAAERQLARLGKVNPLALEEFEALQERAAFLSTQLDDIKNTRRDLLLVVAEVDERVREVFRAAFEDTAREFETVFATLFPGGDGRLVLTDPDDMLTTGIEVEARPPGKKVKRLSLLSGGERSLTAIALLLAIFRARPSPFYVLDEVEAALDDRNLGRLLAALEGLREKSQLIIITHQKRTMEIADALYGVSMRGDGVTTVISQRLRERASA